MAQLLQNFYLFIPYLFVALLMLAAAIGVWLIAQLKKNSSYQNFSIGDRLFMKRNASRLRKVQIH
ncbi:hypothetical protein DYBT9623_04075 [Dyadobacter sp. CECT 9623]|uniref:Uncharacterized protein n=1 Tax=Dyadobacter linearis TaxID=2823330 RepID=A0ABM8UUU6_9BACT|nr:hypothetical protein [Dyadobacter sp. CECT 9623]CAG5072204.1 hypothetical protein DYBT9623_04075 [Dyadobacter sp. CECT 9623]